MTDLNMNYSGPQYPLGLDPEGAQYQSNFPSGTGPAPSIYFEFDSFSSKTIIHVNQETNFLWYIEDDEAAGCSSSFRETENSILEPPKPGNKINYNLGWLLGFRAQKLTVNRSVAYNVSTYVNRQTITLQGKIRSPSTIDLYGPKLFSANLR